MFLTVGRQIEVKIITSGYEDNVYVLTDEETTQFSDMIVKMIVSRK